VTENLNKVSSLTYDSNVGEINRIEQQLQETYDSNVKVKYAFEVHLKSVISEASLKELSALTTNALLQEKPKLHALENIDEITQSIMTKVMSSMKPNSVHGSVKTHSSRSSRSELIALKQAEAESAKIQLKYTFTQQEAANRTQN